METNPYLCRVWHRRGVQPTIPAAGTNRRLTVFGSVVADGRGRVEVIQARQDSIGFEAYLAALEERHDVSGRDMILVLDNGPAHTSKQSQAALAARADWLEVIWLARYSPELNPKEREWHSLKRDVRSHLAADLPTFVAEIRAGLERLGGMEQTVVDLVPDWWLAGHRKPPTGRAPGRPKGAKDSRPRQSRAANLAAPT
jgi:transposase